MTKSIFLRLREKLDESPAEEPIRNFVKHIVMIESQQTHHAIFKYKEKYEEAIEIHLGNFQVQEDEI